MFRRRNPAGCSTDTVTLTCSPTRRALVSADALSRTSWEKQGSRAREDAGERDPDDGRSGPHHRFSLIRKNITSGFT